VASTGAPTIEGKAETGGSVRLKGGAWSGGWDAPWGSRSYRAIVACSDTRGTDCFFLSYGGPVKVAARWAGWHLLAYEWRASQTNYGMPSRAATPFHVGPLAQTALTRLSASLGPVDDATAPAEQVDVDGAPYASVRPRATRRGGRLEIGRVTCPRCKVELTVSGRANLSLRRTLTVRGSKVLSIPAHRGRLTVRVDIDGKTVAKGKTRAG
jgi:hypothetical protein